jgi:hypothetical protein
MIDRSLFSLDVLLDTLLDDMFGNLHPWRRHAEIVPRYMPPHATPDTRAKCVVRWGSEFLRYSAGPRQGYFWDMYGEDFHTPERALLALLSAPVPPSALASAQQGK